MLPVLGPFAAYLGTAAKLFGLVSKIYEWGERAVGRAHTSEEQRAAYVGSWVAMERKTGLSHEDLLVSRL